MFKYFSSILFLCLFAWQNLKADQIIFRTDNDLGVDIDEQYTAGAYFRYDKDAYSILYRYMMFTPSYPTLTEPTKGDRPFAVFEYYGFNYKNTLKNSYYYKAGLYQARTGSNLEGELTQNWIHLRKAELEERDAVLSYGWNTQISNKSGYQMELTLGRLLTEKTERQNLLYSYFFVGTFINKMAVGYNLRWGNGFENHLGTSKKYEDGLSFELDLKINYIASNHLLSGNNKNYKYAVDIKKIVYDAEFNVNYRYRQFLIQLISHFTSKEYTTQSDNSFTNKGHFWNGISVGYSW